MQNIENAIIIFKSYGSESGNKLHFEDHLRKGILIVILKIPLLYSGVGNRFNASCRSHSSGSLCVYPKKSYALFL